MNKRIEILQEKMQEKGIDLLMVQSRPHVFYLTGFDADPHERLLGMVIPKQGDAKLICPAMEVNQIQALFNRTHITGYSDTEDPWAMLFSQLPKEAGVIALEDNIPWSRYQKWHAQYPDADFQSSDPILSGMRLIKSPDELAIMEEAALLADRGIEAGIKALKEGVTEMEVIAQIEYTLKKAGVKEMSFSTMTLFGEKCGDPHGKPGERSLKKGDAVLFDLGVEWKGYTSDMTRTFFFDHATDEQIAIYETVLEAHEKAVALCKPGQEIAALDQAARQVIENAGYGSYFPHRIGHGIGIEVHEFPSLNDQNKDPLKEGTTFTIEPGIYIPNQAGVRIEDEILITGSGCRPLNQFPKELQIVAPRD
ncbi:M24 family metallopeptidase [Salisediminibacterium selenitireducens]|uniref:Peptidase M24 n=1 Tax=Bacillus selenitireducens (strain ATCC 700615 / DSM 15326 / MLS10) TaxID=439292 RepID=D6XSR4_BACIE|nr:Xaa-Pro peptidase family protein [Salisediminibacterium selenitireducens]ADH98850.1 peptidase M24 [[Bacillus] selenitireducens MLS10]